MYVTRQNARACFSGWANKMSQENAFIQNFTFELVGVTALDCTQHFKLLSQDTYIFKYPLKII